MSTDTPPKNWKDAIPSVTWGAIVFTCFFVFIEKLVEQNYGQALFALIVGLGIVAVALHSKTWLEKTNPTVALFIAALIVVALVISPLIEQGRWPFSHTSDPDPGMGAEAGASIQAQVKDKTQEIQDLSERLKHFSTSASADDIAKATAAIRSERDAALSKLTNATKELNDLRQQNETLKQLPAQQSAEKVARYIKLKELLKTAEEARSKLLTFDIHSAMKAWPTNRESQNQNRYYREALRPMLNSDQALKDASNNAFGKTLDLDKSPPEVVNLLFKAPGEEDFQDPAVRTEYRRLYFTNENYKKEADNLVSKLRLDFASISEAIANTPAGDSAMKD